MIALLLSLLTCLSYLGNDNILYQQVEEQANVLKQMEAEAAAGLAAGADGGSAVGLKVHIDQHAVQQARKVGTRRCPRK